MSMTTERSNVFLGDLHRTGADIKVVKDQELTRMSGVVWEEVRVGGKFLCNMVDGQIALGTMDRSVLPEGVSIAA